MAFTVKTKWTRIGARLVRQKAYFAELKGINKVGNAVFAQQSKLFCVLDAPLHVNNLHTFFYTANRYKID